MNRPPPDPSASGRPPPPVGDLSPAERAELLSAYQDGELSDERAREVTTWLEAHPESLAEAERQRRLWDLLGRYADEPVPEGFARRVLAAVGLSARRGARGAAEGPASGGHVSWARPWRLAAAAALLLGVGATALLLSRPAALPPGAGVELATLEALDPDFVQHADLGALLSLSDAQFEALLVADPAALASDSLGG